MKAILKLPFAALAALLLAAAWPAAATDGAVPAPAFTLASRAGGEVSLAELKGQVVMINFWASWCGPCRQEFPALDQIYAKYKPMGFTLVAINVESEKAESWPLAWSAIAPRAKTRSPPATRRARWEIASAVGVAASTR